MPLLLYLDTCDVLFLLVSAPSTSNIDFSRGGLQVRKRAELPKFSGKDDTEEEAEKKKRRKESEQRLSAHRPFSPIQQLTSNTPDSSISPLSSSSSSHPADSTLETNLPSSSEYDSYAESETVSSWQPPENQSGDGRTKLNDKFKGRY